MDLNKPNETYSPFRVVKSEKDILLEIKDVLNDILKEIKVISGSTTLLVKCLVHEPCDEHTMDQDPSFYYKTPEKINDTMQGFQ